MQKYFIVFRFGTQKYLRETLKQSQSWISGVFGFAFWEREMENFWEELFDIELFQIAALKPLLRVELFVNGDIKEQEVFYLDSLHNITNICL